jgi:hypothetical protein
MREKGSLTNSTDRLQNIPSGLEAKRIEEAQEPSGDTTLARIGKFLEKFQHHVKIFSGLEKKFPEYLMKKFEEGFREEFRDLENVGPFGAAETAILENNFLNSIFRYLLPEYGITLRSVYGVICAPLLDENKHVNVLRIEIFLGHPKALGDINLNFVYFEFQITEFSPYCKKRLNFWLGKNSKNHIRFLKNSSIVILEIVEDIKLFLEYGKNSVINFYDENGTELLFSYEYTGLKKSNHI